MKWRSVALPIQNPAFYFFWAMSITYTACVYKSRIYNAFCLYLSFSLCDASGVLFCNGCIVWDVYTRCGYTIMQLRDKSNAEQNADGQKYFWFILMPFFPIVCGKVEVWHFIGHEIVSCDMRKDDFFFCFTKTNVCCIVVLYFFF